MNKKLISNWNSVVKPDDVVFDLGDVVFGGTTKWCNFLSQLNGHHILIKGNHDDKQLQDSIAMKYFDYVDYQLKVIIENRVVYLNHYPFLCYGGAYKSPELQVWQLFGHIHSGPNSRSTDFVNRANMLFPTQYDVGVDNNNFTPISWNQVKTIIESQVKASNEKN